MNINNRHIFFWTTSIGATFFFGLLTYFSFNEWWAIAIKKELSVYTWGHINDNPWYYDNADLYSKVMLTEGLMMLTAVATTVWFLSHKQKAKTFYSLLTCFGLFVLMLISGHIQ